MSPNYILETINVMNKILIIQNEHRDSFKVSKENLYIIKSLANDKHVLIVPCKPIKRVKIIIIQSYT